MREKSSTSSSSQSQSSPQKQKQFAWSQVVQNNNDGKSSTANNETPSLSSTKNGGMKKQRGTNGSNRPANYSSSTAAMQNNMQQEMHQLDFNDEQQGGSHDNDLHNSVPPSPADQQRHPQFHHQPQFWGPTPTTTHHHPHQQILYPPAMPLQTQTSNSASASNSNHSLPSLNNNHDPAASYNNQRQQQQYDMAHQSQQQYPHNSIQQPPTNMHPQHQFYTPHHHMTMTPFDNISQQQQHSFDSQQPPPPPPPPPPLPPNNPITNTQHIYKWDTNNVSRFKSMRNKMLCAFFGGDESSSSGANGDYCNIDGAEKNPISSILSPQPTTTFVRSKSEALPMSPTRRNSYEFDRAASHGASDSNNGLAMPTLHSPNKKKNGKQQQSSRKKLPKVAAKQNNNAADTLAGINSPRNSPEGSPAGNAATNNKPTLEELRSKLNDILPPPQNYISVAIRNLLLDTPLPLTSCNDSSGEDDATTLEETIRIMIPNPPSSSSSNGQSGSSTGMNNVNLIPRQYLIQWILWVRQTLLLESIQNFFAGWERYDDQQIDNDLGDKQPPEERKQQQQHTRYYSLLPDTMGALAALSILAEQYCLQLGDDDNDIEEEFIKWMEEIQGCWNQWLMNVRDFQNYQFELMQGSPQHQLEGQQQQQQQQQSSHIEGQEQFAGLEIEDEGGGSHEEDPQMLGQPSRGEHHHTDSHESNNGDEKKHDVGSPSHHDHHHHDPRQKYPQNSPALHPPMHQANPMSPPHIHSLHSSPYSSPHHHRVQIIQPLPPPPYPHFTFPIYPQPPGPIDCRALCYTPNNHASNSNSSVLMLNEQIILSMRGIIRGSDTDSEQQQLAMCPVPTNFYELLRSNHGVQCTNGHISFNPPSYGNSGGDDRGSSVEAILNEQRSPSENSIQKLVNDAEKAAESGMDKFVGSRRSSMDQSSPSSSLLFHDQWKVNDTPTNSNPDIMANTPNGNRASTNMATPTNSSRNPSIPGSSDDSEEDYPLFAISPAGDGSNEMYQPPPPHPYYANEQNASIPRPIEFKRRLLPVPLSTKDENEDNNSLAGSSTTNNGYLNAAKKNKVTSPYTKLMQEALASKKSMDQGDGSSSVTSRKSGGVGLTIDTSLGKNVALENDDTKNVGYTVEVFPVEFKYRLSATTDDTNNGNRPKRSDPSKHSHEGIALASRTSSIATVLRDLQRAAAPHRPDTCVRIWKKSVCAQATKDGDGYDLLDVTSLCAAPLIRSPIKNPKSSLNKSKQPEPIDSLTIEQWLGMEPLTAQSAKQQSYNPGQVIEVLIEVRSTPTSKWDRESFELENRINVGDYVDAQDSAKKWYEAIVREVKTDTIKVHYFGWGSKWDTELPRRKGSGSKLSPPVPLWTKAARWRNQIKVGDEVEIRESTSLVQRPKWHRATILAVGNEDDIPRELEGGAELELIDVNDVGKKIPLMLLKRKRQILVESKQEISNLPTASPLTPPRNRNGSEGYVAQPPYRRWVNLYGEELCKVNTHKTSNKKQSNTPATLSYTMETKREPVEVMKPFNNIHGSGFVRESLRGIPPATGVVGLHNLGNSCYMNSILQCVNHIKPITQHFLKGEYVNEINKLNPLGSGGRIATAYAAFLNEIYSSDYSIVAPRILKQTVSMFAPQFNNNYQHDSQEFCQYLFDGLHEDLNRVKEKPYVEEVEAFGMEDSKAAMESWKKHLLRHDSIFVDYTQGMHRSHLTCPSCGKESIKFDVYSSISLPLVPTKDRGKSVPLQTCFDQFAAGEQLDEHNAWYCPSCKKHVCALKLITLWNTPDIMVLHLKRFTYEKCPTVDGRLLRRKIEDTVDFPIDRLDLSSYHLGPIDPEAPPVYRLFGVSEHMGTTQTSGHYTATVRNCEDGNWYRYNDSNVGSTSGDAAVTGGAYLLFYQRAKGSLRWAGMEKQMKEHGCTLVDSDGFSEIVGKRKKKRP